ncbi:MAG: hypothetical protein K2H79_05850 [Bacteroidaceae bacterium]|nr:hypothetical protein [Bacteroidaceae bacterium]
MSNLDKSISIYQGYSLAKISALNKKSLAVQYAQCEKIEKLEKNLSRELQAVNRVNQKILDGQLKELKYQETIRFYRVIAHNAKEAVEIIDSQNDFLFKQFLIQVYAKPLGLLLQDAKSHLDEFNDLEFCSTWIKKLDNCSNTIKSFESQFLDSNYYRYLSEQESYFREKQDLEKRNKDIQIAIVQVKPYEEVKKLSLSEYRNPGCFVITIGLIISLIIPVLIIPFILLVLYFYKKRKTYTQYVLELDKLNADNLEKYNKNLNNLYKEGQNVEQAILELDITHPYIIAKEDIISQNPNFEEIISQIDNFIPKENSNVVKAVKKDPLLEEAGRLIILSGTASVSLLQRKYGISFNRAGRIMNQLEAIGVVGPANGSSPRKILVNVDGFKQLLKMDLI